VIRKNLVLGLPILFAVGTSLLVYASPGFAQDPLETHAVVLQEAGAWIASGQGNIAYNKLRSLEARLAGHVKFDTLFGQAALQANEPSIAAFAFERCLSVEPDNGICRLGVARAHLELSEASRARNELSILQQSKPPAAVQKTIDDYLQRLEGVHRSNQDTRLSSYWQWGIGYDSNINNATNLSSMALPALGGYEFTLSRDGRATESLLAEARYNIRYSTPLSDRWRFLSEANLSTTSYLHHHQYNNAVADVSLGVARRANQHQFIAKVQGQHYRLHEKPYRNLIGLLGQYSYSVSERSEATVFVQASRLNYSNSRYFRNNSLRNANRYTLGATWMQGLANDRAVGFVTAYGGGERTVKSRAPKSYEYNFGGLRAGGMYLVTPRLQLEAGLGVESRRHRGQEILFNKRRDDTLFDAYAGLNYSINRKLSIRPQYRFYKNHSNVALYGYKRHIFTVNMRYELF